MPALPQDHDCLPVRMPLPWNLGLGLLILLSSLPVPVAAGEADPHVAEIAVAEGVLRSGPGDEYYETGRLPRGTEVEVYRRGPGPWLAIRPPAGSFSWVEASKVQLTSDASLAEVVSAQAVSWIGSTSGEVADHKWLVQLKPGEVVEVMALKRKTIHQGAAPTSYYQIAPPPGEFRWIRADQVKTAGRASFVARQVSHTDTEGSSPEMKLADFRVVIEQEESSAAPRDGFVARRARRSATSTSSAGSTSSAAPRTQLASRRSQSRAHPDIDARLKELDLQLVLAVTKPPEHWSLDTLREQIEQVAEQADTTVRRARVELLLDKLAEFEELAQRHAGLREADASDAGAVSSAAAESDEDADEASAAYDPRFDGKGWLLPVHSQRRESPPYALLDADGNILQFVSPAPGLNLHRYVRKEVGIYGQRNFVPQLQKTHLTAHRIVSLDRHRE